MASGVASHMRASGATNAIDTPPAVMNSGIPRRTGTQDESTPPTRVNPCELLAEFGRPERLTMDAAGVQTRERDPVCPLCSRPVRNGAAAIELAGLRLHLRCAAWRRRSLRR
jgi:hypothetical protein